MAEKTVTLKLDDEVGASAGHRLAWNCYRVLHGGEGPCTRPRTISGVRDITAAEAARQYVEDLRYGEWLKDDDAADGDEWHVAVETRPGFAVYYTVTLRIIERLDVEVSDNP